MIAHVPRKFLRERTRERGFGITLNTRDRRFDFNVIQENYAVLCELIFLLFSSANFYVLQLWLILNTLSYY